MRNFYGCYLLLSKAPEGRGRTYIGFTVNPRRRIRQHNGEITAGAWKTSRGRPWEMTLVLYGFPTKIQALQFEWAWQHPLRSLIVKPIAQALGSKKLLGVRGKIRLMLSMLHESPWRYFPLTLQYLEPTYAAMVTESEVSAPSHVRVFTAPMKQLPSALDDLDEDEEDRGDGEADEKEELERGGGGGFGGGGGGGDDDDDCEAEYDCDGEEGYSGGEQARRRPHNGRPQGNAAAAAAVAADGGHLPCNMCQVVIKKHILVCSACKVFFHLDCLAARWWSSGGDAGGSGGGAGGGRFGGVPEQGLCPACGAQHSWMEMLEGMQSAGWGNKARGRRGKQAKKEPKRGSKKEPKATAAQAAGAAAAERAATAAAATTTAAPGAKARKRTAKPKAAAAGAQSGDQALQDNGFALDADADVLAGALGPLNVGDGGLQPQQQQQQQPAKPRRKHPAESAGGPGKGRRRAARSKDVAAAACPLATGVAEDLGFSELGQAQGGGVEEAAAPLGGRARRAAPKPRAGKRAAKGCQPAAAPAADGDAGAEGLRGGAFEEENQENDTAPPEPESPSKRQRRGRKPQGTHQAALRPGEAAPERTGCDTTAGVPDADDGACELHRSAAAVKESSPVPLWRRLQARSGTGAGSGSAGGAALGLGAGSADGIKAVGVLASSAAAAAATACGGPRRVIDLAEALTSSSGSSSGSEQEDSYSGAPVSEKRRAGCHCREAVRAMESAAGACSPGGAARPAGDGGGGLLVALSGAELNRGLEPSPALLDSPEWERPQRRRPSPVDPASHISQPEQQEDDMEQQEGEPEEEQQEEGEETEEMGEEGAQQQQVLPDMVVLGTSSECTDAEDLDGSWDGWGALRASPQALCLESPSLLPVSLGQARGTAAAAAAGAPHGGAFLGAGVGPAAQHQPASPMDVSPQPRGRRDGVAVTAAAPQAHAHGGVAAAAEPGLGTADEPVGSPAFGSPIFEEPDRLRPPPQDGPGSAQASGSAGSGLAALMSQLHCGRSTSPQEEQLREAAAWAAGVGGGGGGSGDGGGGRQEPPRAEARPQGRVVVDLCTPQPLRSRLASRLATVKDHAAGTGAGDAYHEGSGAVGRAEHAAGKRLRSPKPPAGGAGGGGSSAGGGVSDSGGGGLAGGARAVGDARPAAAAAAAITRAERAAAASAPAERVDGCGAPSPGGWSVSPWPLRRRCDSPAPMGQGAGGGFRERGQVGRKDKGAGSCGSDGGSGSGAAAASGDRGIRDGNSAAQGWAASGQRRAAGVRDEGVAQLGQQEIAVDDSGTDDDVIVID